MNSKNQAINNREHKYNINYHEFGGYIGSRKGI